MATKTLTITEDAYERLLKAKEKAESFSEVIVKNFPKHSLLELAGLLRNKEAEELKTHLRGRRKESRRRLDQIAQRLQ
ncbi:MAG: antitoxin VapB family protein [Nanoarchaeota archaeon]